MEEPIISEKSCGIIIKDNKLLFYKEQKNDQDKDHGYILKLPWWKVDEWETPDIALVREFYEECWLHLQASQYIHIGTIDGSLFKKWFKVDNGISRLQLFVCSIWDIKIAPKEVSILDVEYLNIQEIKDWIINWSIQEIAWSVLSELIKNKLLF